MLTVEKYDQCQLRKYTFRQVENLCFGRFSAIILHVPLGVNKWRRISKCTPYEMTILLILGEMIFLWSDCSITNPIDKLNGLG